jgi:hypothetical protein
MAGSCQQLWEFLWRCSHLYDPHLQWQSWQTCQEGDRPLSDYSNRNTGLSSLIARMFGLNLIHKGRKCCCQCFHFDKNSISRTAVTPRGRNNIAKFRKLEAVALHQKHLQCCLNPMTCHCEMRALFITCFIMGKVNLMSSLMMNFMRVHVQLLHWQPSHMKCGLNIEIPITTGQYRNWSIAFQAHQCCYHSSCL